MRPLPPTVSTLVQDYLERLRLQLNSLAPAEQADFLREIESHIYEAYWETQGSDDVAVTLSVLRKLGEPAEVVSARLPEALLRQGTRWHAPSYTFAGIFLALFGIPLGLGGAAVLLGIMGSLAAVLLSYYVVLALSALCGSLLLAFAFTRVYWPEMWDRLLEANVIQMNGPARQAVELLGPSLEGVLYGAAGVLLLAASYGLWRLGGRMLRGVSFLSHLLFDWMRRHGRRLREKIRRRFAEHRERRFAFRASRA